MSDDLTTGLLKSVSRSFYLSMKALPPEMRRGVSLGYLLARATDSVADASTAPLTLRREVLSDMGRAVAGEMGAEARRALCDKLSGEMAAAQSHESEARLLQRFGEALAALESASAEEIRLVRQVLATIVEGQLWDLTFFETQPSVENEEQTRRYTYMVAGCVGEFWTELGYAMLAARFAPVSRRELMLRAGVRYGCGLQLVNILRDAAEDAARGRCYLVGERRRWLGRAGRYLADGLDYARHLRGVRLRFATMLPALIGQKTLAMLERAERGAGAGTGTGTKKPGGGKVKIPRRAVYASMLRAAWLSILPPVA